MSVVNMVILLGSVACVLVLEAWEVDVGEALAPDVAGVQVMGVGVLALPLDIEDLRYHQDAAA